MNQRFDIFIRSCLPAYQKILLNGLKGKSNILKEAILSSGSFTKKLLL